MKQFYINRTGTLTILVPLMNPGLTVDSFSFDVSLIVPVIANVTLYGTDLITSLSSLSLCLSSNYLKSTAIHNTSALYGRPHLTVSFTSLKIEFNPVIIRHMTANIQLSTVNNIFKATVWRVTQEI